ncbi:alpha/beta fold hydrolase [Actinomadura rugatobispora]|uniref:Alpha/beta fold hydrolase n=1 Tax=Actinomadura rugatobispora TaxID=1994 RepID=A0ABW1A4J0_9ACTN|nr:alpha/beta hydrolase [Actinomadura rugatobispora]
MPRQQEAVHTQGTPGTAHTRDGRELFYMELPGPATETGPAPRPTVVFEAGMAASRSFWALIQPQVAEWARAVAYDRSGLGRSPADIEPRTLERMADDLNDLLDHLEPGPFILVAHSGGGPIVRAATAAKPDRIAGLVLADATDEGCEPLFDPKFRRMERIAHRASVLLARLGLLKLLYRGQLAALPPDAKADMRAEGFTNTVMRTRGAELHGLVAATNRLRHDPLDLPRDIPVTTISGALADTGMPEKFRAAVNASHRDRAERSAHGRHVLARESGHALILTEPDLVAAEIRRLLDHRPGG